MTVRFPRRFFSACFALILFSLFCVPARAIDNDAQTLLKKAALARPLRYKKAVEDGARFLSTSNARSFLLWWYPSHEPDFKNRPLVTLHDAGGWAVDAFTAWKEAAQEKRFSVLAPQWELGDQTASKPLSTQRIYDEIRIRFKRQGLGRGTAVLHGLGAGAVQTYAIAAMDQESDGYFKLFIADAGGADPSSPAIRDINEGKYGDHPFQDTRWILYCGEKDPNPNRDGCPAMEKTSAWITQKGGIVTLFIRDAARGHEGFAEDPARLRSALASAA